MKKILLFFISFFIYSNSITIYNNNLAYVVEEKNISLKKEDNTINIYNLPKNIIINSIEPQIYSNDIKIYAQSFHIKENFNNYLLKENLNKEVIFYFNNQIKKGTLIKINPIIIRSNKNRLYLINDIYNIIFSYYPSNKKISSYLTLKIDSKKEGNNTLVLKYLVNNINWRSNYIININNNRLFLKEWALINNKSDKDYKHIDINLIVGSLNKIYPNKDEVVILEKSPRAITPKAIEGYYIYKISYKQNILKNQITQILLKEAKDIPFKRYAIASFNSFYNFKNQKLYFNEIIEFNNSKENNLAIPLNGVARVYKNNYYLGESHIAPTPKNEIVKINIGKFFDIIAEVKVIKFINNKNYKYIKKEYIIKNYSNFNTTLILDERVPLIGYKVYFKTNCKKDKCKISNINVFYKKFILTLNSQESFRFFTEYEFIKK